MKNYIQDGDSITVPAAADVTSGTGHLVGTIFGIALANALNGESVTLKRTGVVNHTKLETQAWTVGQRVYWDNTNSRFTTTASGNTLVGVAVAAAANPSTEGQVLLTGQV